jgi:hypothetical protein
VADKWAGKLNGNFVPQKILVCASYSHPAVKGLQIHAMEAGGVSGLLTVAINAIILVDPSGRGFECNGDFAAVTQR